MFNKSVSPFLKMVLPRLAKVKSDQALAFEHKYFSTMANVERKKLQAPAPRIQLASCIPI